MDDTLPTKRTLNFTLEPAVITRLIDAQRSFVTLAESLQPVLHYYAQRQDSFARLTRELPALPNVRLDSLLSASEALARIAETSAHVREINRSIVRFDELANVGLRIHETLDAVSAAVSVSRLDTLAQVYSQRAIAFDLTGLSVSMTETVARMHQMLRPTFDAFTVIREVALRHSNLIKLRLPAREHFLTADVLRSVSGVVTEAPEYERDREVAIVETDNHLTTTIRDTLTSLDPQLCHMWDGAWQAMQSGNPDKTRHALVSARELVTHVLHLLAPDDKVLAWNQSKAMLHQGRPTRKARLLFIYSCVNDPALENYILKEAEACLALIAIFQEGTHGVAVPFTDTQLEIILRRVHSMICALVEIHHLHAR